jgi:hypothetical protein
MGTRELSITVREDDGLIAAAVYWDVSVGGERKLRRLSGTLFSSWKPVLALVERFSAEHPDGIVFIRGGYAA